MLSSIESTKTKVNGQKAEESELLDTNTEIEQIKKRLQQRKKELSLEDSEEEE